jgi:hypothetical protein
MERQGRQLGTKAMIELLQLGGRHGHARLRKAIDSALQLGCTDAAAVRHLMTADDLVHQRPVCWWRSAAHSASTSACCHTCGPMTSCWWPVRHDEPAF